VPRIRLLIVDDHAVVREGLRALFADEGDIECVGEARNGEEGVRLAAACRADVVLLDLMMPGIDGIEATRRIRRECPHTQVVALTSFGDEGRVRAVIEAGAIGYLLKDVLRADLVRAVRNASQGKPALHPLAQRHLMQRVRRETEPSPLASLTPRERTILELVARGHNNQAIADALRLSRGTVKGHVSRVLGKLGLKDRTQAALLAVQNGLAGPDPGLRRAED
jgi:NarL family two-component system response regulator LiaR